MLKGIGLRGGLLRGGMLRGGMCCGGALKKRLVMLHGGTAVGRRVLWE